MSRCYPPRIIYHPIYSYTINWIPRGSRRRRRPNSLCARRPGCPSAEDPPPEVYAEQIRQSWSAKAFHKLTCWVCVAAASFPRCRAASSGSSPSCSQTFRKLTRSVHGYKFVIFGAKRHPQAASRTGRRLFKSSHSGCASIHKSSCWVYVDFGANKCPKAWLPFSRRFST